MGEEKGKANKEKKLTYEELMAQQQLILQIQVLQVMKFGSTTQGRLSKLQMLVQLGNMN